MTSSSLAGTTFFGMDLKKIQARWMRFRKHLSTRVLLIDFDSSSVTFAEARIQAETVSFDHVRRYRLPEEALERGVPAEPDKMAALIRGFCQEAAIPAHRAAVVVPHDAVFTTVLKLPSSVSPTSAIDYVLDPKSAVQLPIQLDQMELDVVPLAVEGGQRSYFITAFPSKLVDRVIDTLQAADLEIVRLQTGLFAQLQHLSTTIHDLAPNDGILHLELLPDYTQATLLCQFGPVRLSRLPAIRDFPELPEQSPTVATDGAKNAEAQIIDSEAYLPISDLDLRSLQQEIRGFIHQCAVEFPGLSVKGLALAGVNSAHPTLSALLQKTLGLPVQVSRPLATAGVGLFTPESPMVAQSLGRLMGLGISLLSASDPVSPSQERSEALERLEGEPESVDSQLEKYDQELVQPQIVESQSVPVVLPFEEEIAVEEPQSAPVLSEAPIFSSEFPAQHDISLSLPRQSESEGGELVQNSELASVLDDSDDVPFSLGDLLTSYEAKAAESTESTTAQQAIPLDVLDDDPEDPDSSN